jgi:hypothetical protein
VVASGAGGGTTTGFVPIYGLPILVGGNNSTTGNVKNDFVLLGSYNSGTFTGSNIIIGTYNTDNSLVAGSGNLLYGNNNTVILNTKTGLSFGDAIFGDFNTIYLTGVSGSNLGIYGDNNSINVTGDLVNSEIYGNSNSIVVTSGSSNYNNAIFGNLNLLKINSGSFNNQNILVGASNQIIYNSGVSNSMCLVGINNLFSGINVGGCGATLIGNINKYISLSGTASTNDLIVGRSNKMTINALKNDSSNNIFGSINTFTDTSLTAGTNLNNSNNYIDGIQNIMTFSKGAAGGNSNNFLVGFQNILTIDSGSAANNSVNFLFGNANSLEATAAQVQTQQNTLIGFSNGIIDCTTCSILGQNNSISGGNTITLIGSSLQVNTANSVYVGTNFGAPTFIQTIDNSGIFYTHTGVWVNSGLASVAQLTQVSGAGHQFPRTTVTNQNYTGSVNDYLISWTSLSAQWTGILPSPTPQNQSFIIKDEAGTAGSSNIVISGTNCTIDGAATKTINSNYGVLKVYSNGTNYFTW